jgi:hypothetical protein
MTGADQTLPLRVKIQIRDEADTADGLMLADGVVEIYREMFQRFAPFRTRDIVIVERQTQRFGVSPHLTVLYPDRSPAVVSYVEPASPPYGTPRLRLKHRSTDTRIFGPGGTPGPLLAHELSHALHFSLMPVRRRMWIATRYLAWIGKEVVGGRPGTHNTFQRTSPFVAWLEAFGLFAERYWRFLSQNPDQTPEQTDKSFLAAESGSSYCRNDLVGTFGDEGFSPHCPGADVEGTVYGLVFVDLAMRVGLPIAVNLYLRSAGYGILDYDGFSSALAGSGVQLSAPG